MSKYDIVPPPFRKKKQDDQKIDESYLVKYGKEPNIYNDTEAEMDTLKSKFKSKMDKERETKEQNTNPNFWFAVYFQDEAQKNEFLAKSHLANETKGLYIDGITLAKAMGIEIQRKEMRIPGKFKSFKE